MTERMKGCDSPERSAEAYASCRMPPEGLDPSMSDEGGLNADHEMQWLSARENIALRTPLLDSQLFLTPPQGLGADLLGGPPSGPGKGLPGETCEEMSRDLADPPCEEMCVREPAEASCKGQRCGLACQPLCDSLHRLTQQSLYKEEEEEEYGEPWGAGKARLPSIVVEPSEGEVESGELRWPPDNFSLLGEDEQDELFAEGEEDLETGLSSFDSDVEEVLL